MRTGAQEHFYLETNATIAVPATGEDGEMTLHSSTQVSNTFAMDNKMFLYVW